MEVGKLDLAQLTYPKFLTAGNTIAIQLDPGCNIVKAGNNICLAGFPDGRESIMEGRFSWSSFEDFLDLVYGLECLEELGMEYLPACVAVGWLSEVAYTSELFWDAALKSSDVFHKFFAALGFDIDFDELGSAVNVGSALGYYPTASLKDKFRMDTGRGIMRLTQKAVCFDSPLTEGSFKTRGIWFPEYRDLEAWGILDSYSMDRLSYHQFMWASLYKLVLQVCDAAGFFKGYLSDRERASVPDYQFIPNGLRSFRTKNCEEIDALIEGWDGF